MLTVLGCPPWTVTKEKTPQSDLIRKGTDTHNMKPGDRVVSGTVYMYTESSGSTKEGMGKVRSRRNYGPLKGGCHRLAAKMESSSQQSQWN